MAIVLDSNSPYYEDFTKDASKNAVYLTGKDPIFGDILSVIYRSSKAPPHKLSSLFISTHGTSGFVDMTLTPQSRYFAAIENLPTAHRSSLVRQALAVSTLRSFATMDCITRKCLNTMDVKWDETTAGYVASKMKLVDGKFPDEVGNKIQNLGVIEPKNINTELLDVIYVDSDSTIEKNNELVYLLGDQLEQLFDPLSEYSPEPTERLYTPPLEDGTEGSGRHSLEKDSHKVQSIIEELFVLQSHFKTNLINFLQDFLIPLRVQVLGNEVDDPEMTIRKLNTIFPPTIDEIVRINNIFFESLQQALPYGSFEIMKACGMTIPYFYKACMRHEAATRGFATNLKKYYTLFRQHLPSSVKYTPRMIESIIQCSLHLARAKLVLERLMNEVQWDPKDQDLVKEFYQSAVGTIDAFGRESSAKAYDRRVFTPTGKVLVEVAKGWPKELEYGWINRRVVTIFDAIDVINEKHQIVLLFTDQLVILEPSETIPMVSASGMHLPSISDVLMHAMINEMPLNENIPELQVVAWVPVEQVVFAEYNQNKNLLVQSQQGLKFTNGNVRHQQMYELVRPDQDATQFVAMLSKAKVMNKTQPFHLFKNDSANLSLYATVHELQGYAQEVHKTPVAVFLNVNVTRDILKANNLTACFKVEFDDSGRNVRVQAFTTLGCGEFDRVVACEEFAKLINQETAYLYSLHYSTKNEQMVQSILDSNRFLTEKLISYSCSGSVRKASGGNSRLHHHQHIKAAPSEVKGAGNPAVIQRHNHKTEPKRRISPVSILSMFRKKPDNSITPTAQSPEPEVPDLHKVPEMTRSDSSSSEEVFEFPPRVSFSEDIDDVAEEGWEDITTGIWDTEEESSIGISSAFEDTNVVRVPGTSSTISSSVLSQRSLNRPVSMDEVDDMTSTEVDSEEERQQRDVSEWFKEYESSIDELSLSSFGEEEEEEDGKVIEQDEAVRQLNNMFNHAPSTPMEASYTYAPSKNGMAVHSSRILDGLLDSSYKQVVQDMNGDHEHEYDFSDSDSVSTVNVDDATLNISDDFAHLAGFWNDRMIDPGNIMDDPPPELPHSHTKLWPDLRDPSIMFLGSYVHSRQHSAEIKEEEKSDNSIAVPFGSLSNTLRFSSINTLQLASFTAEIERLIDQDAMRTQELEQVKQLVVSQYEHTRNMLSSDDFDYDYEVVTRKKLMQLTWTIIGMADDDERYRNIVDGMLKMETLRRLKLHDKLY